MASYPTPPVDESILSPVGFLEVGFSKAEGLWVMTQIARAETGLGLPVRTIVGAAHPCATARQSTFTKTEADGTSASYLRGEDTEKRELRYAMPDRADRSPPYRE